MKGGVVYMPDTKQGIYHQKATEVYTIRYTITIVFILVYEMVNTTV
jgi:hypothetical protein